MKPGSLLIFNKRFSRCQVLHLLQDEENETIVVVSFSSRERFLFFDIFIKKISLYFKLKMNDKFNKTKNKRRKYYEKMAIYF